MKKVFLIMKKQWKTDVQHYGQTDDLQAGFEIENAECFVIQTRYKLALPTSSQFALTVPQLAIGNPQVLSHPATTAQH
jgi:hypothetical protein